MGKTTVKVTDIAQPIVENEGLELVDIEYVKEGDNYFLRVFIDTDEGVGLEECETVSSLLSEKLDELDPIDDSYILEVSSPGIERPLKKLEDFDRFEGNLARLKTYAPIQGSKEFTGHILKRDDELIKLRLKNNDEIIEIPFSSIAAAHLAVDF